MLLDDKHEREMEFEMPVTLSAEIDFFCDVHTCLCNACIRNQKSFSVGSRPDLSHILMQDRKLSAEQMSIIANHNVRWRISLWKDWTEGYLLTFLCV